MALAMTSPLLLSAENSAESFDVKEHYDKTEVMIPMRDGVKLFTAIYTPKNITQRYPIPGLTHLRCLDAGARLENRVGRTDPFGWISQIDELRSEDQNRRQDEEYFPDQGQAFLYSHGT